MVPEEKPRRRDSVSKQSWGRWSRFGVVALVVLLGMIVFEPDPEFEITDTIWQKEGESVIVNSLLHNRTDSAKELTVQFLADFSSVGTFDKSLSFAGRVERSFRVEPDSELAVSVEVPVGGGGGGDVLLTATIVRVE